MLAWLYSVWGVLTWHILKHHFKDLNTPSAPFIGTSPLLGENIFKLIVTFTSAASLLCLLL